MAPPRDRRRGRHAPQQNRTTLIDRDLRVEYATHVAEDLVDLLFDNLAPCHPAAGVTPDRHWVHVHITIPARDLTDAINPGLASTRAAGAPVPVVTVGVFTNAWFGVRTSA